MNEFSLLRHFCVACGFDHRGILVVESGTFFPWDVLTGTFERSALGPHIVNMKLFFKLHSCLFSVNVRLVYWTTNYHVKHVSMHWNCDPESGKFEKTTLCSLGGLKDCTLLCLPIYRTFPCLVSMSAGILLSLFIEYLVAMVLKKLCQHSYIALYQLLSF